MVHRLDRNRFEPGLRAGNSSSLQLPVHREQVRDPAGDLVGDVGGFGHAVEMIEQHDAATGPATRAISRPIATGSGTTLTTCGA